MFRISIFRDRNTGYRGGAGGRGGGGWGNVEWLLMGTRFLFSDENILKLIMAMVALLCEYTKSHWHVYFKWVNCNLYKLYLSKAANNKSSSWLQCTEQRWGRWTNEEATTGMEQKTVVELRGGIHGGQTGGGQVRTVYILWQAPQVLLGS